MKDTLWLVWSVTCVAALLAANLLQPIVPWISPLSVLAIFLVIGAPLFWRMVQRW